MISLSALCPCSVLALVIVGVLLPPVVHSSELSAVCTDLCERLSIDSDDPGCEDACEQYFLETAAALDDGYQPLYPDDDDALFAALPSDMAKRSRQQNARMPYLRRGSRQKSAFIRIGRSVPSETEYELSRAAFPDLQEKRASSFVRIGRDPDMSKRLSNFVRIGRSRADADEKRASSFVRIGRAGSHFVRIGKSMNDADDDKRASSFVRIGKSDLGSMEGEAEKRASSFVRIGKKSDDASSVDDKRGMSEFVRIGKSSENGDAQEKRASSFIRIGKSPLDDSVLDETEKRASNFVRIGRGRNSLINGLKRKSNFIRIGKKDDSSLSAASSE